MERHERETEAKMGEVVQAEFKKVPKEKLDSQALDKFMEELKDQIVKEGRRVVEMVTKIGPVGKFFDRRVVDLTMLDPKKIEKITEGLPEVDRANNIFMKAYTKFNDIFLGCQMLYPRTSPQRLAWQILAKLERKREALRENYFKIAKDMVEIESIIKRLEETDDELERKKLLLELAEKKAGLQSSILYYKEAVKEVGNFLYMYKKMKEKGLIPENWDEKDFEEEDFKANLMNAFYQAMIFFHQHRGVLPNSQTEYFYKLGINPGAAIAFLVKWYPKIYGDPSRGIEPPKDASVWDEFLEAAWEEFKDCIKVPAKYFGIDIENGDKWYDEDFIFLDENLQKALEQTEE